MSGSARRLEVLLAAALIEYGRGCSHEQAIAAAESQRLPEVIRKVALLLIAWSHRKDGDLEPLVLVEVPRERSGRARELAPGCAP